MTTNILMTKMSEWIPDVSHVLWFNSSTLSHKPKNLLRNTCLPACVRAHTSVNYFKKKSHIFCGINNAGEKEFI